MIYIAERRLRRRHSISQTIKIYSNQEKVELFVNGESLGENSRSYGRFIWNQVELKYGENNIAAESKNNITDKIVITVVKRSGN